MASNPYHDLGSMVALSLVNATVLDKGMLCIYGEVLSNLWQMQELQKADWQEVFMKSLRHFSFVLVSILVVASCVFGSVEQGFSLRMDLMTQPGIELAQFPFKEAPFKSCHASTIAETKKYFVVAFFAGTGEGHKDVGIWVCRKDKETGEWSAPFEAVNGIQFEWAGEKEVKRFACWNPVLYQPWKAPLFLFYKVGPSPDNWWGMRAMSSTQGRRWTAMRRLPEGITGPVRAKPVELPLHGVLLCGSSTENDGWRVHMEMTKTLGRTWKRTKALNDGKDFAAIQPTILPYDDGRIQILCRSDGHIRESWSTDSGISWSPLVPCILPNPSAGIDAVKLKDGRHLLVYNHSSRGRSKLNVAVTEDGKHWKAALKLEDGTTIGGLKAHGAYPAAILGSDGLVHVTYTWTRGRINYVVIDPNKLVLREMPDGKWPQDKQPDEKVKVTEDEVLGQAGLLKSEFVFHGTDFTECHSPTVVETGRGITIGWMSGKHEKHYDVGVWYSRRAGEVWTEPKEIVRASKADGETSRVWNPSMFEPKEGPLLLFYRVGPSPKNWWGMIMRSEDGGGKWSEPQRLPDGILGPIKNKPVQLADGTLLCGSSTEDKGWRIHTERSSDLGRTWMKTGPIEDAGGFSAIQPAVLFHGDGKLQILCRAAKKRKIATAWSSDNGLSWTGLSQIHLPNASAGIDAVTLKDGRHLLVYNHTNRWQSGPDQRRERLNVAVSDDGIKWKAALLLEHTLLGEFAYPAVIQSSDGKVHIVYSWNRRKLKHVLVDPNKLVLREMVDGKWPG